MTTQKPQKQTEHSRNFEKYKGYYDHGFWNAKMLENAVVKKAITRGLYKIVKTPATVSGHTDRMTLAGFYKGGSLETY